MLNKLKKTLKKCGIYISRYRIENNFELCVNSLLKKNHINLVLDVGANTGQYALGLRDIGYSDRIISFEPQKSVYIQLESVTRSDDKWESMNIALGDVNDTTNINVSKNTYSSSLLNISPTHVNAEPDSKYIGMESIEIRKLSDVIVVDAKDSIFLKIDVQGYELNVLKGCENVLHNVKLVLIEMSLIELYIGSPDMFDVIEYMKSHGFELYSLDRGYCEPGTGRLLQVDGLFYKPKNVA